ncbi:MAG: hypothetical protein ABL955_13330, partial [Elusimicrobiota bacterium]
MDRLRSFALILFLASPAGSAVHLSIAPGPLAPDAVRRTEAAASRLLETPERAFVSGGLNFTGPTWNKDLPELERERALRALKALWGKRLSVREDPAAAAFSAKLEPPPSAFDHRARADEMQARLDGMPQPLDRTGQDRFYDGSRSRQSSAVAAGPFAPGARAAQSTTAPRLK